MDNDLELKQATDEEPLPNTVMVWPMEFAQYVKSESARP